MILENEIPGTTQWGWQQDPLPGSEFMNETDYD